MNSLLRSLLSVVLLSANWLVARAETPAEWLKKQPAPKFRKGHTLPLLTRYGWTLPLDTRIELTRRWGYALDFGGYATEEFVKEALNDPKSDQGQMIALTAKDPKRFPLCVVLSRDLPANPPEETWTHTAEGKRYGEEGLWSPEAPLSVLNDAAELRAGPLRKLRARVPIAVVLNGGEYALGVLGFARKGWEADPHIVAAKGKRDWFDYISEKKGLMETVISQKVRSAVPDRQIYIYYTSGGGTHRNRTPDWQDWCFGYEWMRTASDMPSNEYYYRHYNTGWTGENDMLTLALNARGHELKYGVRFSYDWLSGGWIDEPEQAPKEENKNPAALVDPNAGFLGDLTLYTGFLRCLYISGMLGGNAGYYALPKGGFGAEFPARQPPHWLQQMVVLSRVHALFSYHDLFLRQSDLLPGPDKNRWSKDQSAYEFPTGTKDVRVLVRKRRGQQEWMLVAWSASGKSAQVTVTVPQMGKVNLEARPEGALYLAKSRNRLQLSRIDKD